MVLIFIQWIPFIFDLKLEPIEYIEINVIKLNFREENNVLVFELHTVDVNKELDEYVKKCC